MIAEDKFKCMLAMNQTGFEDDQNRYREGCGFFFRHVDPQQPIRNPGGGSK